MVLEIMIMGKFLEDSRMIILISHRHLLRLVILVGSKMIMVMHRLNQRKSARRSIIIM